MQEEKQMKIIAIRHGQTDRNAAGRIQGRTGIPLNEKGREQARKTAEFLRNHNIDIVVSSTLKRAVETAEIIAEQLKIIEIIADERLCERNFGDYDGVPIKDVDIVSLRNYTANVSISNGETIREVYIRVSEYLDVLLEKYKGKNILLVLHGHVIRAVLWYFNGLPKTDEDSTFEIDNCAIYEFESEDL
jgi:broad specificity phosphatase PhoE